MICSSCETLFCSQFNLVFSNLEFVCLSVRESWLVANKGGRMDIRIMYCVKQKFPPNERSGWKMCLNPKSLEIINPTILQLLIRAGWWLTTVTGWTLALCIASNKTLDSTDDWDKRGDNFCPNIKRCLQSIISRWLSICVQSFVHKTCQLYGLFHCPVQHNAIFVPVCVCLRLLVLSSCVSVSLGLWVSLCVCVFVCTCNDLRHVTSPLVGEVSIPPTTLCACSFRKEISDLLFCF